MELTSVELTKDELDSVFGGSGHYVRCPNDGFGCPPGSHCCKPY